MVDMKLIKLELRANAHFNFRGDQANIIETRDILRYMRISHKQT